MEFLRAVMKTEKKQKIISPVICSRLVVETFFHAMTIQSIEKVVNPWAGQGNLNKKIVKELDVRKSQKKRK